MTIQFLRAWNGYEQSQVVSTLPAAEETRLIGLGLARSYTTGMDGESFNLVVVGPDGILRDSETQAPVSGGGGPLRAAARYAASGQLSQPTVMASPPTVTNEASNAQPSVWNKAISNYKYVDFWGIAAGTGAGVWTRKTAAAYCSHVDYSLNKTTFQGFNDGMALWGAYPLNQVQPSPIGYAFQTDSPLFGIACQVGSAALTILIDQNDGQGWQLLGADYLAGASGNWYVLDWLGVRKARRYMVQIHGTSASVFGLGMDTADTCNAVDLSGMMHIVHVGDSYGTIHGRQWANSIIGRLCGLFRSPNFAADCIGSTGYRQAAAAQRAIDRLDNAVALPFGTGGADMVVVALGLNDGIDPNANAPYINAYFPALRRVQPKALVIALNAWTAASGVSGASGLDAGVGQVVYAAIQADSGPWAYIDTINGRWYTSWGATGRCAGPMQTGDGRAVTFTSALSGATSATLTGVWTGNTASTYRIRFSNGTIKSGITLTNGSAAVSWSGGVTATAAAGIYTTTAGNSIFYIGDGVHANGDGADYLGSGIDDAVIAILASYPF